MASEINVDKIIPQSGTTLELGDSGDTITVTGTLDGSGLTGLNADNLASGTVPTARLGSGTASSSTFLAGDQTFKTVTGTTINNNADNRVITGSGTANTLEGEANLVFDGSKLGINTSSPSRNLQVTDSGDGNAVIAVKSSNDTYSSIFFGDTSADNVGKLQYDHSDNSYKIVVNSSEAMHINSSGNVGIGVTPVRHFHLHDDTQPYLHITNNTTGTTTGDGFDILIDSSTGKAIFNQRENQPIEFMTNNNARMQIDASGHLLPSTSNTYDLGSSSLVWRNIYTSDFHMSNENLDKGNDVDGTKGSWTFQEGADDLFLLNNKNGKKYKFKLEECK